MNIGRVWVSGITVPILITIGDVEINVPCGLTCVNVETQLSVMNPLAANIAAPTPAANKAEARSHVPEAGCWTSVRLARMGDVTPAMIPPCNWTMTNPASFVLARRHA